LRDSGNVAKNGVTFEMFILGKADG
jgi:hypothetical protein